MTTYGFFLINQSYNFLSWLENIAMQMLKIIAKSMNLNKKTWIASRVCLGGVLCGVICGWFSGFFTKFTSEKIEYLGQNIYIFKDF